MLGSLSNVCSAPPSFVSYTLARQTQLNTQMSRGSELAHSNEGHPYAVQTRAEGVPTWGSSSAALSARLTARLQACHSSKFWQLRPCSAGIWPSKSSSLCPMSSALAMRESCRARYCAGRSEQCEAMSTLLGSMKGGGATARDCTHCTRTMSRQMHVAVLLVLPADSATPALQGLQR